MVPQLQQSKLVVNLHTYHNFRSLKSPANLVFWTNKTQKHKFNSMWPYVHIEH